jgi:hypothetical protein
VRLVTVLALAVAGVGLTGCGSMMASMPLVGEPKNAPARPAENAPFPGVFVETANPEEDKMTAAEREKLKADLITARDTAAARKRDEINKPKAASKTKKQATPAQKCEKEPCPR